MDCYCDLPIPIPICTTLFSFYTKKSLPSYFLHIQVLFSKFLNVSLSHHFSCKVFGPPSFCSSEFIGICSSQPPTRHSHSLILNVSVSHRKYSHHLLLNSLSTSQYFLTLTCFYTIKPDLSLEVTTE